jgi:hypothetical protein
MLTPMLNSCKPDAKKKKAPTDQSSCQGQWGHKTLAGLQVRSLPRGTEATLAKAEWVLSIRKTTISEINRPAQKSEETAYLLIHTLACKDPSGKCGRYIVKEVECRVC